MTLITPIAETADTVTLRRADWEALLDRIEDLQDTVAVAAHRAHVALVGKDVAEAGYLSIMELRRLLNWESPVKIWREKRGLSQRDLAERANVSPSYLAEIETGKKPGSSEALLHLSRTLGVRMEDLAERDRVEMMVAFLKDIVDGSSASPEQAAEAAQDILAEWGHANPGQSGSRPQAPTELYERIRNLAADYERMGLARQANVAFAMTQRLRSQQAAE
jgi:transcriptional regulator with XRE-family HTH domain